MMVDEPTRAFARHAGRYPMPFLMSPEEQVKAGLKSLRNPERFSLSEIGDDASSGRTLPLRTTFVLDLARMVAALPQPQKAIVLLYFCARRPDAAHCDGDGCQTCQQHYGNEQVARDLTAYGYHLTARSVGQYKQHAVASMAARLWPVYFRRMKRRKMAV
jgi:hypothetical protein